MRFRTRDLTTNLSRTLVVDCVQQDTGCGDDTGAPQEVPCEQSQPPCQDQSAPPPPCEQDSQQVEISSCSNTIPCDEKRKAKKGGGASAMKRAIRAQMARSAKGR